MIAYVLYVHIFGFSLDKPGKADIKVITPSSGKVDIQDEVELQCELDSDKEGNPQHSKYAFTNGTWTSDTQESNKITVNTNYT